MPSHTHRGAGAIRAVVVIPVLVAAVALTACTPATSDERTKDSVFASRIEGSDAKSSSSGTVTPVVAAVRGTDSGMSPAPAPRIAPARDTDQDFLRHMLDHHETVLVAVHALMMAPSGHAAHGTTMDPSWWDGALDKEKTEMLVLLKSQYNEDYSPRMARSVIAARTAPSAGMPMPSGNESAEGEAEHMASLPQLAAQLRDGATLVDRFTPRLKRAAVRDLARRIRVSQLELAGKLRMGARDP